MKQTKSKIKIQQQSKHYISHVDIFKEIATKKLATNLKQHDIKRTQRLEYLKKTNPQSR